MTNRKHNLAAVIGAFLLVVLAAAAFTVAMSGCSAEYWTGRIEPQTSISVNPVTKSITFKDTKDNDLLLEGLRSTGADGKLTSLDIDKLSIRNASNTVIAADAARMEQMEKIMEIQVQMHQVIGQNLVNITQALTGLLGQLGPVIHPPAPTPTPTPTPVPLLLPGVTEAAQ